MRDKIESLFLVSDTYGSGPYCRERDVHKLESDYAELEELAELEADRNKAANMKIEELESELKIAVDAFHKILDSDMQPYDFIYKTLEKLEGTK